MTITNNIQDLLPLLDKAAVDTAHSFLQALAAGTETFTPGTKKALNGGMAAVLIAAEKSHTYDGVLEAHRRFHDLHYTLEGSDIIVAKPVKDCVLVQKEYDAEGDYILFTEQPETQLALEEGWFCLLPPADAHMALVGDGGTVKKIVFKIPVTKAGE